MCVEILALWIRNSNQFEGIRVNKREFKILQYADDTALFISGSNKSFKKVLEMISLFTQFTGLKLNSQKTQIIFLGNLKKTILDIELEVNLIKDTYFRYLGTDFHVNIDKIPDFNYDRIFDKLKRQMISWSKRNITPLGRITVAKSLLLPQFNHLFLSIPSPSAQLMKNIKVKFFQFVWNGKPDKISREQILGSYEEGGLKMIDLDCFNKALKLTWLRRILLRKCDDVESLLGFFLGQPFHLFYGDEYFYNISEKISNPFWKEIFSMLFLIFKKSENINWLAQPLWKNSKIQIDGKSVYFKHWQEKGIRFIND